MEFKLVHELKNLKGRVTTAGTTVSLFSFTLNLAVVVAAGEQSNHCVSVTRRSKVKRTVVPRLDIRTDIPKGVT